MREHLHSNCIWTIHMMHTSSQSKGSRSIPETKTCKNYIDSAKHAYNKPMASRKQPKSFGKPTKRKKLARQSTMQSNRIQTTNNH